MIKGTVLQVQTPEWQPLLALAGEPFVNQFMWMHEVQLRDGRRLHAFKHIVTRDYLHLCAQTGAAFRYLSPNNYVPVAPADLMADVLAPMLRGELVCEDGWVACATAAIEQVRAREEPAQAA